MQSLRTKKVKSGQITLKDKFILSPIEKFIYYDKFPHKLLIHIALIIFTTVQVLKLVDSYGAIHAREQRRVFKSLLLNSTEERDIIQLYTPLDLQEHLQKVVYAFQNLNLYLFQEANTNPTSFDLDCYYQSAIIKENRSKIYSIYPVDILNGVFEPFDINNILSIKAFMNTVLQVSLTATNLITTVNQHGGASVCAIWNISLVYNFESYSAINAQIISNEMPCNFPDTAKTTSSLYSFNDNNKFIHITVMLLAISSILLAFKHIYSIGTLYMKAKHAYKKMFKLQKLLRKNLRKEFEEHQHELIAGAEAESNDLNLKELMAKNLSWEEVPVSEKLKFFNFWFITSIIGNCFQITGSFSILLSSASTATFNDKTLTIDNVFIGIGCFFAWFQSFYYLEFNRNVVLVTSVFKKSTMLNMVFFGLTIPVFIAFVCLGQAFFWNYDKFNSTGSSANSLFALFCGDIVYESFTDTINESYIKQLFFFAYLITFYTSVQNIFVAIVMEGYERTLIRKELDNDDPFPDLQKVRCETEVSDSKSEPEPSENEAKSDAGPYTVKKAEGPGLSAFGRMNQMKLSLPFRPSDSGYGREDETDNPFDQANTENAQQKTLERFSEMKTPRLECTDKLKAMTKRIKEKLLDMKKLVDISANSGWSQPDKDFIEDIYDQHLDDLCNKINFLTKGIL